MKKAFCIAMIVMFLFSGCEAAPAATGAKADTQKTVEIGNRLADSQPTPTDIEYSLERYNLIRRAYWVNGQREKARTVPQPLADVPLGYCILLTESGAVVGNFIVDGKVTSLNSFLSPDSEVYEMGESMSDGVTHWDNKWLADVDGSYGENDNGIFFFTPDGKYIEWTGIYLYSDIPFEVNDPVLKVGE